MKNPSDTIENRSRDLPACSAGFQQPAPPRTGPTESWIINILDKQEWLNLNFYVSLILQGWVMEQTAAGRIVMWKLSLVARTNFS